MPGYGDGWKRRGQARAALGHPEAALADFTKALALVADPRGRAEALAERGTLLQKQRDLRRAAKDLEEATALDQGSKQVRGGCTSVHVACGKRQDMARFPQPSVGWVTGAAAVTWRVWMGREATRTVIYQNSPATRMCSHAALTWPACCIGARCGTCWACAGQAWATSRAVWLLTSAPSRSRPTSARPGST